MNAAAMVADLIEFPVPVVHPTRPDGGQPPSARVEGVRCGDLFAPARATADTPTREGGDGPPAAAAAAVLVPMSGGHGLAVAVVLLGFTLLGASMWGPLARRRRRDGSDR